MSRDNNIITYLALANRLIFERRQRLRYFQSDFFSEPAWDILLDLFVCKLENKRISISSACIAANVPTSTALRWVTHLHERGILERMQSDNDRRSAHVQLSDESFNNMIRYLENIANISGMELIPIGATYGQ